MLDRSCFVEESANPPRMPALSNRRNERRGPREHKVLAVSHRGRCCLTQEEGTNYVMLRALRNACFTAFSKQHSTCATPSSKHFATFLRARVVRPRCQCRDTSLLACSLTAAPRIDQGVAPTTVIIRSLAYTSQRSPAGSLLGLRPLYHTQALAPHKCPGYILNTVPASRFLG